MSTMLDSDDEAALMQAMHLIREVMDKHWQQLTSHVILRLNEAMDDIVRASKMMREDTAA